MVAEDFLSFHQDGYSGSIAFVLTLAKDWDVEDGGVLQMCIDHRGSYIGCKNFVPTFNRLVLFRTRGGPPIPHRVRVALPFPILSRSLYFFIWMTGHACKSTV